MPARNPSLKGRGERIHAGEEQKEAHDNVQTCKPAGPVGLEVEIEYVGEHATAPEAAGPTAEAPRLRLHPITATADVALRGLDELDAAIAVATGSARTTARVAATTPPGETH